MLDSVGDDVVRQEQQETCSSRRSATVRYKVKIEIEEVALETNNGGRR